MARIDEKKDQPLIEVIREPEMPISRTKPRRRLIVMLGSFLGVFVGVFGVFAWHWYGINFGSNAERIEEKHTGI